MLLITNHHGFYEVWSRNGAGHILARFAFFVAAVSFCGGRAFRISL